MAEGLMDRVGMTGERDVSNGDWFGGAPTVLFDEAPNMFRGLPVANVGEAHGDDPGAGTGGEEGGPRTDPGKTSTDRKDWGGD
jgi:hypothetical protein